MQRCDHHSEHNTDWNNDLTDNCLEAGTITNFDTKSGRIIITVQWDCGTKKSYSYSEWCNLRAYQLGPAGYLGQMVFCDKCLDPSKGLAFRLARKNTKVGDLYDLCVQCYCEGDDEHTASNFHCNIPSGNIDRDDANHSKKSLPTREESQKYKILGLFKKATVQALDSKKWPATKPKGQNMIEHLMFSRKTI